MTVFDRQTWNRWSNHPLFLAGALVLAFGLMFGAPVLLGELAEQAQPTPATAADDQHVDDAEHAGDADHGAAEGYADGHGDEHGEGHHEEGGTKHPPTLIGILANLIEGKELHGPDEAHNPVARFLVANVVPIYSFFVIVFLGWISFMATRDLRLIPGGLQNFMEWVVEGLQGLVVGVIGPEGKRFVPFLGSLFLFIYLQNIFGLIPLGFSSTSVVNTTFALAIVVFIYVQYVGISANGIGGYLYHMAGEPKDAIGWGMAPLMFPLHLVGELAKPVSLSLRLFGNVMGGETLLAVFIGLGIAMLAALNLPLGIPLHTPFLFLEVLVTLVQALVFTLLSTIYFALALPHHEDAH